MTNAAAIGYMILAAKKMKLDKDVIRELESMMYHMMDKYSEAEAEKTYRKN